MPPETPFRRILRWRPGERVVEADFLRAADAVRRGRTESRKPVATEPDRAGSPVPVRERRAPGRCCADAFPVTSRAMHSDPTIRLLGRVLRHRRPLILTIVSYIRLRPRLGISLGMILPFADLLFSKGKPSATAAVGGDGRVPGADPARGAGQRGNLVLLRRPHGVLQKICLLLVVAFAVKGVFSFLLAAASVTLEERVLRDLTGRPLRAPAGTVDGLVREGAPVICSPRDEIDVDVVRKGVSSLYRTAPRDVLLVFVYLGVVILASWRLALLSFAVFPALALLISVIGRRIRKHATRTQVRMGDLSSIFQESIGGIRVVKAFGGEPHAVESLPRRHRELPQSAIRLRRVALSRVPPRSSAERSARSWCFGRAGTSARRDGSVVGLVHHLPRRDGLAHAAGARALAAADAPQGRRRRRAAHLRDPGHAAEGPRPGRRPRGGPPRAGDHVRGRLIRSRPGRARHPRRRPHDPAW